jgi:hypothetical protein
VLGAYFKGCDMNVVLLGNCQVEKLALLLRIINPNINISFVKQVHLPDNSENDKLDFFKSLDKCDFIFSHRISNGYDKEYVVSDTLRNAYADKIKFITNFWFNGYDPSFFILRKKDGTPVNGPLGPNCFQHILDGYISNFSVDEIYSNWISMRGYEEKSIALTDSSISDLMSRDEFLDVKCADWVGENYRNKLIAHTVNHPSISFLLHQAKCIAKFLSPNSVNDIDESVIPDSYKLNFYSIAPNPFISKYYDLKIIGDDMFRGFNVDGYSNNAGVRIFNRKELISYYLEFLDSLGSRVDEFLVSQLHSHK